MNRAANVAIYVLSLDDKSVGFFRLTAAFFLREFVSILLQVYVPWFVFMEARSSALFAGVFFAFKFVFGHARKMLQNLGE